MFCKNSYQWFKNVNSSVIRQKGKSQNGCSYVCVSGGKKCPLFGKFGALFFLGTPVLRFALLLYYRQTILSKRAILDAWLGPECASACGYNTNLEIQTDISSNLTASKDGIILINYLYLMLRSVNCLGTSRPLKQITKAYTQCRSQEHLFIKFSATYHQNIYVGVYFLTNSMLSTILLNTFRRSMAFLF